MSTSEFKSGFVSIAGRPNVGKSTLLNQLLGEKIAIISNKPQTTRHKITAIKNTDDYQIVFVDTPGVHKPRTKLGEYMNREAFGSLEGVDLALVVAEADKPVSTVEERLIGNLSKQAIPTILALNKVDTVPKEGLLPLIAAYSELYDFAAIIPISALRGEGLDILMDEVLKHIPAGPQYYPDDMITDQPERQIAAEIIREKLLRLLDKEIPHGIAVEITAMEDASKIMNIGATIYCEKSSHKSIVIGKNGDILKMVGTHAREDMEKFWDKKVYLELWVKIKQDWRNSNFMLRSLGYSHER